MFAKVVLSVLGCLIVSCTSELRTFHLADFIEFYSSLSKCTNPNSVIQEQQIQYSTCLSKIVPSDTDYVEFYRKSCSNEKEFRKCWKPIILKSKECNSANGRGHPSSFNLVIKAICKKDQGRSFADNLAKSMQASQLINKEEVCSASGEHWMTACKDLAIDDRDICKKHSALTKCIEKITCKEVPIGLLFLDVYREAGKIQGCVPQNSTTTHKTQQNQQGRRYKKPTGY